MLNKLFYGAALAAVLSAVAASATAADTLSAGSGVPFTNYQPSLALTEDFTMEGIYPANSSGGLQDGADHYSLAMIRNFGFGYNPGERAADGGLLSITPNSAVYSLVGIAYGGDGVSTFAAPNLQGTTIIGATSPNGQMATDGYQVGQALGSANTTLTVAQLPAHDHTLPGGGVTGVTGGGAPIDQHEPSLTMTYLIATGGIYPGQGNAVSVGQVAAFAGGFVPQGWRPADGEILNIADNPTLFSLIGNTYGGDGVTTFALPDLRGRTIVGAGTGAGLAPVALGEAFGSGSTVLTLSQLASHDHGLPAGGATGTTGGGAPIDNAQPSLGLNYLVSTSGIFPTTDYTPDPDNQTLGEIIAFAGNYAPKGYAFADGRLLDISQNIALFSLFGTYYGGDGVRTFALPDLRGRDIVGTGGGLTIGTQLGAESVSLTEANLPDHTHTLAAVPEPATWATTTLGLGLAGAAFRRRRRAAWA